MMSKPILSSTRCTHGKVKSLDGYKDFECIRRHLYFQYSYQLNSTPLILRTCIFPFCDALSIIGVPESSNVSTEMRYDISKQITMLYKRNTDRCRYVDMSHTCFQLMCIYIVFLSCALSQICQAPSY